MGMLSEFKAFIMRGNVLDLAVAVIIGAAFGLVVTAFTGGVLMPLIAAIVGEPNFDALDFKVGDGVIRYGTFLTAVVNFVIVAAALFLVVRTAARLQRPRTEPAEEAPIPSDEAVLLTEIRDLLATRR